MSRWVADNYIWTLYSIIFIVPIIFQNTVDVVQIGEFNRRKSCRKMSRHQKTDLLQYLLYQPSSSTSHLSSPQTLSCFKWLYHHSNCVSKHIHMLEEVNMATSRPNCALSHTESKPGICHHKLAKCCLTCQMILRKWVEKATDT